MDWKSQSSITSTTKRNQGAIMDDTMIIDIWDAFKEYIPEKNREPAASQFIDLLVGNDIDNDILESLLGYDPHLDSAIELVLNNNDDPDDEDDDWDDDDDDDDDDEDY